MAKPNEREAIIRECWDAISAEIKEGDLGGNGCDRNAQCNGMVLAANILAGMMGWTKSNYGKDVSRETTN